MGANVAKVKEAVINGFNPRTRDGGEKIGVPVMSSFKRFNPRTRDGCEGLSHQRHISLSSFNPRTRDGCESSYNGMRLVLAVSIHAPVMGAKVLIKIVIYFLTFQSTHP